jgi:hypothetical protein
MVANYNTTKSLTRWGKARRDYLKECKPLSYLAMELDESLFPHCLAIQSQAEARRVRALDAAEAANPYNRNTQMMEWVQHMNYKLEQVEELIRTELIFE